MQVSFRVCFGGGRPLLGDGETDQWFTDEAIALLPDLDVKFAPKLPDGCDFWCLTVIRL